MTDRARRLLACLLTLALGLGAVAAAAQPPPPSTDPPPPAPDAGTRDTDAAEPPPPVPDARRTPRAALETFLGAFYPETENPDLRTAATVLDLEAVPAALRPRRGEELAAQLKAVLDRVERIDLDAVPDRADAEPWRIAARDLGEIVLAPDTRGDWRFTAATVTAVPELFRRSRAWQVVEGVREAPETVGMWLRGRVPESLQGAGFLLEPWQWLGLLLLIAIGALVERTVAALLRRLFVRRIAVRLETVDTDALERALAPVGLLAAGLLWWIGIFWFDLPTSALQVLLVAVRFAVVVAVVWVAYRLADVFSAVLEARAAATETKYDDLLAPLVRKTLKIAVAAFGLLFIADNLDVDISSLLAGIGIGGLAIALAAQDLVKNLFGSLMVILDRPFAVGDSVVVDDIEGTVDEVGFRSTRIRTHYNSLVTMPNARLISAAVDNYGARRYRRWKTTLGLTYDTPPDKLDAFCEGVRELIRQRDDTRKDGFQVHVNAFSASSIDVLLYLFFDTQDWATELRGRHQLAIDILRLAHDLGVSFAFPTQTVHLASGGDGATSGDPSQPADVAPPGFGPTAAATAGRERARDLSRQPSDGP